MKPLNAQSIADGRSGSPSVPPEFFWIDLTARVNRALSTNYKIHELQVMPGDQLVALVLWIEPAANEMS